MCPLKQIPPLQKKYCYNSCYNNGCLLPLMLQLLQTVKAERYLHHLTDTEHTPMSTTNPRPDLALHVIKQLRNGRTLIEALAP